MNGWEEHKSCSLWQHREEGRELQKMKVGLKASSNHREPRYPDIRAIESSREQRGK
jgi:hypothetical protein